MFNSFVKFFRWLFYVEPMKTRALQIDMLKAECLEKDKQNKGLRNEVSRLRKERKHYKSKIEALYNESTKLGHIRKEKVQLMCMQALQVPK